MNICTVLLVSYNHKNSIKKAIESVLNQKTKYKYIIKIFDDCSNDGTIDIIKSYKASNLKIHINKKNIGSQANFWQAYKSVKTKYCTILECDDFWCDENKLEMQIDALEKNPDCSFCAHQTIIENHDKLRSYSDGKPIVTNEKILNNNIVDFEDIKNEEKGYYNHVSSRLIRMSCIDLKNIERKEAFLYDNCQYHYLLLKGKMYFINKAMSCHVQTGNGEFSGLSAFERIEKHTKALMDFLEETNSAHQEKIIRELHYFINHYFKIIDKQGENI